ncbi:MAG: ribonuclease HII [Chloroflexi bacterium]|nr:ribonuclease HII [Chloroflexota bacterium]
MRPYLRHVPAQRPTRRRELAHRRNGARVIVGLDEVGRGPLAGPRETAAVAMPLDRRPAWLAELRDSKQLSPQRRERLAPRILEGAWQCSLGWVHASELDQLGMTAALRLASRRATDGLSVSPDIVLADGRDDLRLACATEMIVKGDASVASIAAASIVAKVARDQWMVELDERFPGYGFARHKGYASPQHLATLQSLGPCPEHRRSFAPVANLIQPRLPLDGALDAAGS